MSACGPSEGPEGSEAKPGPRARAIEVEPRELEDSSPAVDGFFGVWDDSLL